MSAIYERITVSIYVYTQLIKNSVSGTENRTFYFMYNFN